MPMYDSAFRMNTGQTPSDAMISPAIAGPTARETLIAMLFSATAEASCARGTSSGTIAAHAGRTSALPTPKAKVKPRRAHIVVRPSAVSTPRMPAQTRR